MQIFNLQIRTNEKQMEELRSTNEALQERLESMYRSLSLSPSSGTAPGMWEYIYRFLVLYQSVKEWIFIL